MLKKNFLVSLVILQGLLILIGIIAIIFGIFYKMSNDSNSVKILNKNIDTRNIYLINEKKKKKKIVEDNKVIFQIIDFESDKIVKEIIIEKN